MGLLVKACLNGRRAPGSHPALPLTPGELAADAAAAVAAGAGALHVHPRDAHGRELLDLVAIDAAVAAIRAACPGLPVGVSTGEWILPDLAARVAAIGAWSEPDFASVNLSEQGHGEVMAACGTRAWASRPASGPSTTSARSSAAASPTASYVC